MKLLALTLLNLSAILTVIGVWKYLVGSCFKMRLLSAWRIITIKNYHLMTKNKQGLIQHVSSAYGLYDEKWLSESGVRIDSVIDQMDAKEQQDANLDYACNLLNGVK